MKKSLIIALGASYLLSGTMNIETAQGATIQNNFGLNTPTKKITFNEITLPNGTGVIDQYASLGILFPPLTIEDIEIAKLYYVFPLNPLPNLGTAGVTNFASFEDFSLKFTSNQTEVAFSMGTDPTLSTITALLKGKPVESFDVTTNFTQTNNFFGFKDIIFDEIRINLPINNDQSIPNAIIGEVQLGKSVPPPLEVPEPTSILSLFVIGFLGIHATRKG